MLETFRELKKILSKEEFEVLFKKTYLQLKILLEKSKSWEGADLEKIKAESEELDKNYEEWTKIRH